MAQRATSLGPKPSFLCSFSPFFAFDRKPVFLPRKGSFCFILSASLCFSLALFCLPLFHFLFLCLSFSLSLSISCCFLLPSFLSFLFAFFWFLVFVSLSFFFLFCFMKNNITYSITKLFSSVLSLLWVFCLVFSFKSHFLIFSCF